MNTNNGKTYHQNVLYVAVKKSRFIKEQEVSGLLKGSGIKTPSSNIPLLGNIFFNLLIAIMI